MDFTITSKKFADLSVREFYRIAQLRVAVFVVEQNCPYQEIDELDEVATHLYFTADSGDLAAYGRIYQDDSGVHLGRIIVAKDFRRHKLGTKLVTALLQTAQTLYPCDEIIIAAQAHLQKFYGNLGFQTVSKEYLEDGIPHVEMSWKK